MSKTSAAQRERKRVHRGERKAEQAALVDKGKRYDADKQLWAEAVEHSNELAQRLGDAHHETAQAKRECVALEKEIARLHETANGFKVQVQEAKRLGESQADRLAHQEKELAKLRSEDRDASKLRRRLHERTKELREARAKYNQVVREVRSGKFEDQKAASK